MKVTLKALNDGYQALVRLSQQDIPKDQFKLAYKIGRVYKSAKVEIEALTETLEKMMREHGFSKYDSIDVIQADTDRSKKIEEYNHASMRFLKTTEIDLWGDPFTPNEILGIISISPQDIGDLHGWLIVGELSEDQIALSAMA